MRKSPAPALTQIQSRLPLVPSHVSRRGRIQKHVGCGLGSLHAGRRSGLAGIPARLDQRRPANKTRVGVCFAAGVFYKMKRHYYSPSLLTLRMYREVVPTLRDTALQAAQLWPRRARGEDYVGISGCKVHVPLPSTIQTRRASPASCCSCAFASSCISMILRTLSSSSLHWCNIWQFAPSSVRAAHSTPFPQSSSPLLQQAPPLPIWLNCSAEPSRAGPVSHCQPAPNHGRRRPWRRAKLSTTDDVASPARHHRGQTSNVCIFGPERQRSGLCPRRRVHRGGRGSIWGPAAIRE